MNPKLLIKKGFYFLVSHFGMSLFPIMRFGHILVDIKVTDKLSVSLYPHISILLLYGNECEAVIF